MTHAVLRAPTSPAAPAPAAGLAGLRPGQSLAAVVVAGAAGETLLKLGGTLVAAQAELPLAPGERLTVRVVENGPRLVLAVEARAGPAAATGPDAALAGGRNGTVTSSDAEPLTEGGPLRTVAARALGERILVLTGGAPAALPDAVPRLAAELLARMPEAVALGTLLELLPADDGDPPREVAAAASRRLARLLRRAGGDPARLAAAIEPLAPAERRELWRAAAARERRLLAETPELSWLRSLHEAATVLAEARPETSAGTPSQDEVAASAFLLPSLQPAGPPDRLRLAPGEPERGGGTGRPPATVTLELGLPALGPLVASLLLKGDALTVRIELAAAQQVPAVTAALPELTAALAGLGLTVGASAGTFTAVAPLLSLPSGAAAAGLDLWA